MKALFFITALSLSVTGFSQTVRITTRNGLVVTTRPYAVSNEALFTESGTFSYAEIVAIGMRKGGAAAGGAMVGGVLGLTVGSLTGLGAPLGLAAGAGVGAIVASTSKWYKIDGDKTKFEFFVNKNFSKLPVPLQPVAAVQSKPDSVNKLIEVNAEQHKETVTSLPVIINAGVADQYKGVQMSQTVLSKKYNLKEVKVRLREDKVFRGKLIACSEDSLYLLSTVYGSQDRRTLHRIGYEEIEYVGIHKVGAGGTGAAVGALAGVGLGIAIGMSTTTDDPPPPPPDPYGCNWFSFSFSKEEKSIPFAAVGLLVGTGVGSIVGSSNRRHHIDGDKGKFDSFVNEISLKPAPVEDPIPKKDTTPRK